MKSDALPKSLVAWWVFGGCLTGLIVAMPGCGKQEPLEARALSRSEPAETIKLADRPFYDAAKPFAEAIVARDYAKAFDSLSSYARARMSPNQFVAPENEATAASNDNAAVENASVATFTRMLGPTEKQFGRPSKILNLYVFSTNPVALSGKGQSALEKLDSMFAIGMMPASIPMVIRKASLLGMLKVELRPDQLAVAAKLQQTTPEKLKSDPDFQPYVNLKIVLVQEAGALKVGYFEFLPPGIMD